MTAAVLRLPEPDKHEFSTDAPPHAEDLAAAFAEFLPVAGGDKRAAAILATGAVLAGVLARESEASPR